MPYQNPIAELHDVRWFLLRTGRIVTRFQKLLDQIENGEPAAEAERDALLERYSDTVGDNPADLCLLDFIPARNQAAAHSPRLARAFNRLALAYGRFISSIDPSYRYFAAAIAMRRVMGRWTSPSIETIKESVTRLREAAGRFEKSSEELGELDKWNESTIARLGGPELGQLAIRDRNKAKRYKRNGLVAAFEHDAGRAIYRAIGAGAYEHDAAYLHHIWAALDNEQTESVYRDIFRLTVSGWHALQKAGYGRMRLYPGCEYDQHLEPFQRETKWLVENARAIAGLLDSHAASLTSEAAPDESTKDLPVDSESSPVEPAEKRERRKQARLKAVAALIKHHGYAKGWVENYSPIKAADLTKAAGNKSPETASKLFRDTWGSHAAYKLACEGDPDIFRDKLNKMLSPYQRARESFGPDATNA